MGNQATTGGFFNTATRLMSSVLGSNKKGKEPVKSIQLAAAAAKKVIINLNLCDSNVDKI